MSATQRLWRILRARLRARRREPFVADPTWADPAWAGAPSSPPHGPPWGSGGKTQPAVDPLMARYYANLEIPYGSDLEAVDRAWKRLLSKYHPDRHATDPERQRVANELVKELNRAREELRRRLEKDRA